LQKFDPKIEKALEKCRELDAAARLHGKKDEQFWIVSDEVGRLLNAKAKEIKARYILEIGTSIGYSTMFFAEAVAPEKGKVYTIESNRERATIAREHIEASGLAPYIHLTRNHAPEHIPFQDPDTGNSLEGKIDILFLDCIKMYYLRCFEAAEPLLRPGSLVIADNILSHPEPLADFVKKIQSDPSIESEIIDIGTGLLIAKMP
jgi:predicted O-methyltransferase YrrM